MSNGAVLAVPACGRGLGGGHMIRCMALVRGLRERGRDSWLYLPRNANANNLIRAMNFNRNWLIDEDGLAEKNWECIVLDRFRTPPGEAAGWRKLAPVIGIDEGGPCRNDFDFLIDILPGCYRTGANIADPSLLPLPEKKPFTPSRMESSSLKILVSFGQEDAAGLGPAVVKALAKKNCPGTEITLLRGSIGDQEADKLSGEKNGLSIKIMDMIPGLNEHLGDYDIVITHYGITAFETLYSGAMAMLVSPSAYHEKLAGAAGFLSAGTGKGKAKQIARLLIGKKGVDFSFLRKLQKRCAALAKKYGLNNAPRQTLAELINSIAPEVSRNCPACGAACSAASETGPRENALARFPERTYRMCPRCGVIRMDRLNPPPIEYAQDYFFGQYKKQYGKTYLEDFPNLTAMARRRLAVIKGYVKPQKKDPPLLLDIGCAYGPFLAAAREEGFSPFGIDPAEEAVEYVKQTFGIPAAQGFFPSAALDRARLPVSFTPPFDVITLWYVIEHFQDCVPALAEIRKLLKPGGVFAFATPSCTGVSGRGSPHKFLERSPADHWTIWSPAACKKALALAGFRVVKITGSGHHPERFPLLGQYAQNEKSPLYRILLAASKKFALGDTFEVYAAVKK